MFDFAWSEIALIGIVALVAIGPKDLPVAIKAVSQMVKKARKMAGEFQTHVDEMVREADLGEMKNSFNEIRRMDLKGTILRAVDDDGSIRKTLTDPVDFSPPPPPIPVHDTVSETPAAVEAGSPLPVVDVAAPAEAVPAPAFVPPRYAPQSERAIRVAPAFVPPAYCPPSPVPAAASPAAVPAAASPAAVAIDAA